MTAEQLRKLAQRSPYDSPWSFWVRVRMVLWEVVWFLLFRPSPKPLYPWRVFLLKFFGCRVSGMPFVASSAWVKMPWQLTLEHRACLGPKSEVYNLGHVTLKARCMISQEAYLCGGTHDFSDPNLNLVVGDITVGPDAWVGARAFVMPGVEIGEGAVVGACAVVTKDVAPWAIVAGNPAKVIGRRECASQDSTREQQA